MHHCMYMYVWVERHKKPVVSVNPPKTLKNFILIVIGASDCVGISRSNFFYIHTEIGGEEREKTN